MTGMGAGVHGCVKAGSFVVVPQLFKSVHVCVCCPSLVQTPKPLQDQLGVQEDVQYWIVAGLLVVTPQLFESVQVLVCT